MTVPPSFDAAATVHELAALGMRVARAVARLVEIETEMAEVLAADLPARGPWPAGLAEATEAGVALDMAEAVLAKAGPRTVELARAFDRVSRSVRRSVALGQRLEAGWPVRAADTRGAMVRRQVSQGVAAAIRDAATGEAAERLFDDPVCRLVAARFRVWGYAISARLPTGGRDGCRVIPSSATSTLASG